MKSLIAPLLICIAADAYAASCAKIEYAEAKDWSPEQLEQAYCADLETSYQSYKRASEYFGRNPQAANVILDASRACDENMQLFERILKNVHKRTGVPSCKK